MRGGWGNEVGRRGKALRFVGGALLLRVFRVVDLGIVNDIVVVVV